MNRVDLTNCDREPIHVIGRIQSFGVLLGVSPDWIVTYASRNVTELCGRPAEELIGLPATVILRDEAIHSLRTRLQMLSLPDSVERVFSVDLTGDGRRFDVALHRSGRDIVIEAEEVGSDTLQQYINYVRPMTDRVKQGGSARQMCDIAARQLRALTGFHRVKVYRFSPDGSGEVIAESRAGGIDSFLGLHFPATDIPAQARTLYMRNMLRIISDVNDPTVEVIPATNPDGEPLDLTMSTLRAVSPIHIEYLKNMGVEASLSVSIMREGQLWGLFACHHYEPRVLAYPVRTAAELFGEIFSYLLDQAESQYSRTLRDSASRMHDSLMTRLAEGGSLLSDFPGFADSMAQIIPHDGIAAWIDGEFVERGATPTRDQFMGLVRFLNTTGTSKIWSTDHVAGIFPAGEDFRERAAGLLAIPVSRSPRDYVVLFRQEIARTVAWAGNPEKPVTLGPLGDRLTPRKSFETWQQVVTGRSREWTDDERQTAEHLRVTLIEVVLRLTDAANQERVQASKRQEILIAELNHRVRNILNLIRSLVTQSQPQSGSISDYAEMLGSRIYALARAHDQLTKSNWEPTSLRQLIAVEASSYLNHNASRIAVTGTEAILNPAAITALALVLHELMTNSSKYGALSVPDGRVTMRLVREPDNALTIGWKESNGPVVHPPKRRGFGSTIIERSIPHELDGDAEVNYLPSGVTARFMIPPEHIARYPDVVGASGAAEPASNRPVAVDLPEDVLVVEDNVLIAMEAEEVLLALGAQRIHVTANVRDALRRLEEKTIGIALVDINLGNETSERVAARLKEVGVPFLLATGYGEGTEGTEAFAGVPVVTKPYTATELSQAIAKVLGPA